MMNLYINVNIFFSPSKFFLWGNSPENFKRFERIFFFISEIFLLFLKNNILLKYYVFMNN